MTGQLSAQEQQASAWEPVWEPIEAPTAASIDEPPLPTARTVAAAPPAPQPAGPGAQAAPATPAPPPGHTPPPPPVDERPAPIADDPNALERIYGDDHRNPHATRFEPHHPHAERHAPKFDAFNKHTINDRPSKFIAGRSGVVSHGHGVFMLKKTKPHATRYTFVRQGNTNVAVPFDVIDRDDLTRINWKAPHQGKHPHKTRLLVNPSNPRTLHIQGKDHLCVLTWAGKLSSAWMSTDDLEHGDQIAHAARSRAHREDPEATSWRAVARIKLIFRAVLATHVAERNRMIAASRITPAASR